MAAQQLDLFAPPPAPGPRHFYVAGFRIKRDLDLPYGGQEGDPQRLTGWRAGFLREPDAWPVGGHAPYCLRLTLTTWARVAGLPLDLYARGWRRDDRPGLEHWLVGEGVSCCLDSLDANIDAARRMRPPSELRAWADWRAAQQQPTKKKARAA